MYLFCILQVILLCKIIQCFIERALSKVSNQNKKQTTHLIHKENVICERSHFDSVFQIFLSNFLFVPLVVCLPIQHMYKVCIVILYMCVCRKWKNFFFFFLTVSQYSKSKISNSTFVLCLQLIEVFLYSHNSLVSSNMLPFRCWLYCICYKDMAFICNISDSFYLYLLPYTELSEKFRFFFPLQINT